MIMNHHNLIRNLQAIRSAGPGNVRVTHYQSRADDDDIYDYYYLTYLYVYTSSTVAGT